MEGQSGIFKRELDALARDLVAKHRELGMRASGLWEQSLSVKVEGLRGAIYGQSYTGQLAKGRAPGRFPPIGAIESWIVAKGINPIAQKATTSSLAFLIARKIAEEGTRYFRQGGTDLISSVVTPERVQEIIDRVAEFQISRFTSEMKGVFENLMAA